jgi:hypothetical protein
VRCSKIAEAEAAVSRVQQCSTSDNGYCRSALLVKLLPPGCQTVHCVAQVLMLQPRQECLFAAAVVSVTMAAACSCFTAGT